MNRPIHERERELLALSLYDELDADERRALDAHLADCAACRAFGDELARTLGPLRARAGVPAADELPADWAERLRAVVAPPAAPARHWRWAGVFAAGLAAGCLGTLSLVHRAGEPGVPPVEPRMVAQAGGERADALAAVFARPPVGPVPRAADGGQLARLGTQRRR